MYSAVIEVATAARSGKALSLNWLVESTIVPQCSKSSIVPLLTSVGTCPFPTFNSSLANAESSPSTMTCTLVYRLDIFSYFHSYDHMSSSAERPFDITVYGLTKVTMTANKTAEVGPRH